MAQVNVTIVNEEGMHARPAAVFVKEANTFESSVEIISGGKATNAKSIMSLMALGLKKDAEIIIKAEGSDEEQATLALSTLINNKFNL